MKHLKSFENLWVLCFHKAFFINNSPDDDNSIKGLKNFTIIKIIISKIEWLFLASQGHRRAKFEIDREGSLTKIIRKWLVP